MENHEKKSPVEWFAEEVSKSLQFGHMSRQRYNELREQAKAMEKEQEEKTYSKAFNAGYDNATEYYNKTFKSK